MTPLRVVVAVLVAVLVLTIGGCVIFGIGSQQEGDVDDLTTPTQTTP
jgi:hypothetical protein